MSSDGFPKLVLLYIISGAIYIALLIIMVCVDNLCYNISTSLVFRFLDFLLLSRFVYMLQVERIALDFRRSER